MSDEVAVAVLPIFALRILAMEKTPIADALEPGSKWPI